jgi:hypothetical protein
MTDVNGLVEARKKELLALAQKRRIDVSAALEAAGKDNRQLLGTLAKALGIDARIALNLGHPLRIHD